MSRCVNKFSSRCVSVCTCVCVYTSCECLFGYLVTPIHTGRFYLLPWAVFSWLSIEDSYLSRTHSCKWRWMHRPPCPPLCSVLSSFICRCLFTHTCGLLVHTFFTWCTRPCWRVLVRMHRSGDQNRSCICSVVASISHWVVISVVSILPS